MKASLSDAQLAQLAAFVETQMGVCFTPARWDDLERHADMAVKELGYPDTAAFLQGLPSAPITQAQIELLASHLTISESYFWREPRVFEALSEQILPDLITLRKKDNRYLRIWSAGCSTGEEPYSIAILLRSLIPDLENWNITLLATDINPMVLRKGSAGVYGEWSFRAVPPGFRENNFSHREKGKFEILPEIRRMVTFAYLNLAEDCGPSPIAQPNAMDIIFCRNVLMYFSSEHAKRVGKRLFQSLTEGGWLIVSACELAQHAFPQSATVNFPGAIVYRKIDSHVSADTPSGPVNALLHRQNFDYSRIYREDDSKPFPPTPKKEMPFLWPIALAPEAGKKQEKPSIGTKETIRACKEITCSMDFKKQRPETPFFFEKEQVIPLLHLREEPPVDVLPAIRELANLGRLGEARTAYEQAIAADKLNPGLYYLGATILQEMGMEKEAMVELRRALYLEPDFVMAHFTLGKLSMNQGNRTAAKKSFENALALMSVYGQEAVLPGSEGLMVGRLHEVIGQFFSRGG